MPYPVADEAACREWIESRPLNVRKVVEKYPPTLCYRLRGGSGKAYGHFRICSYGEHPDGTVTVKIIHGADSTLPGVIVFGVSPDDLVTCDCGKFEAIGWIEGD